MSKQTFIIANAQVRERIVSAIREADTGKVVTISEPTRSSAQNAALHAWLTEIAKTLEWAGKKRDLEVWKRLLTAAWLRARGESVELLPALDGHGVDVVFRRTSSLTKAECSELLEFVVAWAVENNVGLVG